MRMASDSSSFGVRFAKRGVFRSIASTPRFIVVFARGHFATAHWFGLRKFYGALKTTSKGRGAAVDRHCLERDAARENQAVIIGVILRCCDLHYPHSFRFAGAFLDEFDLDVVVGL